MIPHIPIKMRGRIEIYQRGIYGDSDQSESLLNGIRSRTVLDKRSKQIPNYIIIIMNDLKAIKVSLDTFSFLYSASIVA